MRKFDTGATRDDDSAKLDYEGFESPLVMRRFAEYMHSHRIQANGEIRDSDNWQKGIPVEAYMKSMFRHFMDLWLIHRGQPVDNIEEVLCAIRFNVNGYLHEVVKQRLGAEKQLHHPDLFFAECHCEKCWLEKNGR